MALQNSLVAHGLPLPIIDLRSDGYRILAFGKPHDWSFRPYSTGASAQVVQALAPSVYIPKIASDYGLGQTLYAPIPSTFNALTCSEADVAKACVELYSVPYQKSVWLLRGAYADGMVLHKTSSYAVSLAGCSLLTLRGKNTDLGVAHAGRDSLLDRGMLEGNPPRPYESVVMSLVEAMCKGTTSAKDLRAQIVFPIEAKEFTHPWEHQVYGAANKRMTEYIASRWGPACIEGYKDPRKRALGRISLYQIIRAQLVSLGVEEKNISLLPAPSHRFWFDTRSNRGNPLARNLVIIQNL